MLTTEMEFVGGTAGCVLRKTES